MILRGIAGLIVTLVLWTAIVVIFRVPAFLLPGPLEVFARLLFLFENAKLFRHIGVTLTEIVAGFVIGTAVGILAGVVFARLPRVERFATPLILLLQTAPKIAIAPLLLLWLGIGPTPKIVLIAIVTFFPVMSGMVTGLRYGEGSFRDLAAVLKLSPWQSFWHIELPSALPAVLAGMAVATTLAMTAAVIGELMGANEGIGYLLSSGQENSDTAVVIGMVLLLSLIGWAFYEVIELIRRHSLGRFQLS
ncbi:Nitrate/sulfonate/bicarbonate ABC transporter, permease protein (plasmid) [Neorhizobium galegae bv. officinalis bv. officinalis str. HAMBI 1141]|uniref:Nitrate/sulfonate/bicarbonate ABC transporter, permease protein n=1 Tax=Neorhizobium galegae bv. officinalis bv. officinalis str. HAMBI 1141 TaxID=1028801 RepID=A0A068TGA5_NEOGA|nr:MULTISPECIES: ABC transporter permease [Neorhizobium]MCJ9669606.1 ABC transporter permease [Neorhizobium sp. SHOUNA12B]MCJ9745983.1 ABC transporter permease [Neorhizobium sp. SHOUNA12A]CDN57477.1 Nitrate/sulfonate/bicarbonate ABC transporter, permease protein [Neorhizobium galegae bv. officinalis bv. officinalis str. HAMBI 1141]